MKRLFKNILLIVVCAMVAIPAMAQQRGDYKQFRENIREYKHKYFQQKLDMTSEQANEFFELYDKMEDEINQLHEDARTIETKYYDAPDGTVTDTEYGIATKALTESKCKEAEIEKQYYEEFDKILSKRQLFELRKVEREFTRQLLKYHHRNGKKENK